MMSMKPISQSKLAALIDLGLSDEMLARYLATEVSTVAELRNSLALGQSRRPDDAAAGEAVSDRTPGTAVVQMRHQARLLIERARGSADARQRLEAAVRAFEMAQVAEQEERRLLDMGATLARSANSRPQRRDTDAAAALTDKATRWRKRAEEYWTVSETMRTSLARETHAHLARSYQRLADQFEARARHSLSKKEIIRKDGAG